MGVLEGHTPMIVMLRGGTIDLYEGDRVTERLFVNGGFAEVTPERCTVLANEAVPLAELNRAEAEKQLAEAEAAYEAADKRARDRNTRSDAGRGHQKLCCRCGEGPQEHRREKDQQRRENDGIPPKAPGKPRRRKLWCG